MRNMERTSREGVDRRSRLTQRFGGLEKLKKDRSEKEKKRRNIGIDRHPIR